MSEKPILTREQILAAPDLPISDPIHVPEWGGYVHVRSMTAGEKDDFELWAFEAAQKKAPDRNRQMRARMVIACVVDAAGNHLFTPADAPALAAKSNNAVSRVTDAISKHNRLDPKERQALAKN